MKTVLNFPRSLRSRSGHVLKFALAVWVVVGLAAQPTRATNVPDGQPLRVACVGDSITDGYQMPDKAHNAYPVQLAVLLGIGWEVRNFGVSGATLMRRGGYPYDQQPAFAAALAWKPDVVVVALGTNDTKTENIGTHPEDFIPSYRALLADFRAANPRVKIFLCLPPPAFPEAMGISDRVLQQEILPRIRQVAAEEKYPLIDLHSALENDAALFPDKIHPTAAGAARIAKLVYRELMSALQPGAKSLDEARKTTLAPAAALVLVSSARAAQPDAVLRERVSFDTGWRFAFGHPSDPTKDFNHGTAYFSYFAKAGNGDGPADPKFDASAWRELSLPHDWAVEAPFDGKGSHSHGYKAIGRNFPERSVGWYRKTFEISESDLGRRVSLEFDGVHRDSQVWVNGFYLGRESSGSTSFRYDITDYLNYGGANTVAVRVDVTMEEGWYYEGAGIYRHVWLTKTAPLHVAPWGTFVTTDVRDDFSQADVTARATIANDGKAAATFQLEQTVVDPDGGSIATKTLSALSVAPGEALEFSVVLAVAKPRLWSLEKPALHRLVTIVRDAAGAMVDRYETPFGIRTTRWDPNQGFFLNGQHVLIKGTNNHQDHAGVGVAVPDALWDFRIKRLKEFGSNAYRSAHHPPAPELLEACDRLGMLVLDENRLMGTSPAQLGTLEAMIRRDRNHPSVILWSVGNEEWAIEGNEKGARISAAMQAFAHRLDPTRRTTVAISGGWGAGSSSTADVMGYNYFTHGSTDDQHAKFPHQPGVGTEETTDQGTRGIYFDDKPRAHQIPPAKGDSGGNVEIGWQHFATRPYLAGLFYWTGFDYRGESNPFGFPAVSTQFGIMDTCGFPKDQYYFLKSWWTDEAVLHVFPHWNWPDKIGQTLKVGCYSNHEAVELFLNGESLGKKEMPRNGHLEWQVVYQPGVLEARGYRGGKVVQTTRVETTGAPAKLVLTPDRQKLRADGADVAVFAISTVDAEGRHVPTANMLVKFAATGGRIIGVGNGDPSCHEPDKGSERSLFNGYAQVIVQATREAGEIRLSAQADGLPPAEVVVASEAPKTTDTSSW